MSRRREHPLPKLQISLEALPPPETNRTEVSLIRFSLAEKAMIDAAARARGEQPAVLLRTIILTAFQNSALKALTDDPDLLAMSPLEQQKALLAAFAIEGRAARRPTSPKPPKGGSPVKRAARGRSPGRPPSR